MNGGQSLRMGKESASWSGRVKQFTLALSLAGLVLAVSGCPGGGNKPPDSGKKLTSGVSMDPSARQVAIPPTYCPNPGRLDLSKGAKHRYQWHNVSGVDLLIVFKDSAGNEYQAGAELVPNGQYSAVHVVCETCPETVYEYRLKRLDSGVWVEAACTEGAPTVPEVSVGP